MKIKDKMAGRRQSQKDRAEDYNALMQSQLFAHMGMMPTPAQASLQTAMLPQIMQMKQAELMQNLAMKSREAYMNTFEKYYKFTNPELQTFKGQFDEVKETIMKMIPDGNEDLKKLYSGFLSTYPDMWMTMIPKEILQAKLSQKCGEQNNELRQAIPRISQMIVEIMRELARLQETLGVTPIVQTVLGDMPDPIALMTNPQYAPYKTAMAVFQAAKDWATAIDAEGKIQTDPEFTKDALKYMKDRGYETNGIPAGNDNEAFNADQVKETIKLLSSTAMGSACAPYGPEFNQKGAKPNKNAAACLASGEDAAWSTGNPNDPKGAKQIYRAQRLPDGSIDWVLTGDMAPVVAGFPGMPDPNAFPSAYLQGMQGMPCAGGFYQPQPKARKSKKSKSASKAKKSKK